MALEDDQKVLFHKALAVAQHPELAARLAQKLLMLAEWQHISQALQFIEESELEYYHRRVVYVPWKETGSVRVELDPVETRDDS